MSLDLDAWLAAVRDGVAAAVPTAGAFAQHVAVRASTGSTNDDVARAALEGAPEGYTVIAAEQTGGRGRRGASWHSPSARGLYVSTLLRPDRWAAVRDDPSSPAPSLITLMAGVAVVNAIRDVGDGPVELKWPNDVMVRTNSESPLPQWRKLAGILAEGASDGGALRSVVLGIGINLAPSDAPADVASRLTTLDDERVATDLAPRARLQALVTALLVRLSQGTRVLAAGGADRIRDQWQRLSPSVEGATVRWHDQARAREGRTAGIDPRGALRVSTAEGECLVHGGDLDWVLEPVLDIGAFCREVEAHLCRVNGGHLVRIVGPSFDLVSGWAREGMPIRIVLHGVDRTVARATARGPRRRPVRVEFCEADVRDAYDRWRQAVGAHAAAQVRGNASGGTPPASPVRSLPKHLERVLVRLSATVATRDLPASFRDALDGTLRDVDACLDAARGARGEARLALVERLARIERVMTEAAVAALDDGRRASLREQAQRELASYRGQMPPEALRDAEDALVGDLVRKHFSLPQVRFDG